MTAPIQRARVETKDGITLRRHETDPAGRVMLQIERWPLSIVVFLSADEWITLNTNTPDPAP